MGVRGNVRRSTDGHIIHANVDTDVIISEEPEYGSTAKPEEIYAIIEHFSLGERTHARQLLNSPAHPFMRSGAVNTRLAPLPSC